MTAAEQNAFTIGRIQGYLEAFARFNSKTNHGYSFGLEVLEKSESVEKTLYEHLDDSAGVQPDSLRLRLIVDIETELQTALAGWLFSFLSESDPHYHLTDAHQDFSLFLEPYRRKDVKAFTKLISEVARPIAAYKVDSQPVQWYEAAWEDVALEGEEQVFLLHLGVSD